MLNIFSKFTVIKHVSILNDRETGVTNSFLSYIYLVLKLEGCFWVFLPNMLVDYFLVWQGNGIYHHWGKS